MVRCSVPQLVRCGIFSRFEMTEDWLELGRCGYVTLQTFNGQMTRVYRRECAACLAFLV